MTDWTWDDTESTAGDDRRDTVRMVIWIALALLVVVGLVLIATMVLSDETRDPLYREAQEDNRSIGPTNGRLDDGSMVGAATFFDENGVVCSVFGPPGERSDDLYCVPDTAEEVDAINWEIDPEENIDLTVMIVDGEYPRVDFVFDGPTPGHAVGWFPIAGPAVVTVYVGPPWQALDIDPG
jgi:hypothetical protein